MNCKRLLGFSTINTSSRPHKIIVFDLCFSKDNLLSLARQQYIYSTEAMKLLVIFTILYFVTPVSGHAQAGPQRCVSCSSSNCYKSTQKTKSCGRKCFTILLREHSPDDKPFIIKGCTSDQVFARRRCDNKCYEERKEFGSIKYYQCVYCCTGDKCNHGSQAKSGVILTFVSATLALVKYLYFY